MMSGGLLNEIRNRRSLRPHRLPLSVAFVLFPLLLDPPLDESTIRVPRVRFGPRLNEWEDVEISASAKQCTTVA